MFKDLNNILNDKKFKITILDNKVNINNYDFIILAESEKVLLNANNKIVKIIGKDLLITKLLNNEVLIEGEIKAVEMR